MFGFDLDECVVDFLPALIPIVEKKYGIKISREYISRSSIEERYNIPKVNLVECIDLAISNVGSIKPMSGAMEFLLEYHFESRESLVFITSRWDRDSTVTWLSSWLFPIPWEVYFVEGHFKSEAVKKRGVRIFVEDHDEGTLELARNKVRVLLMDKPWNKGISDSKYIKRVRSWDDIFSVYKRLREREPYASIFNS